MEDRELLELAAKASGFELHWVGVDPHIVFERWSGNPAEDPQQDSQSWNPLTDDGGALRLACTLKIDVMFSQEIKPMHAHHTVTAWSSESQRSDEFLRDDEASALRRAIVRAAAEIGKSK